MNRASASTTRASEKATGLKDAILAREHGLFSGEKVEVLSVDGKFLR